MATAANIAVVVGRRGVATGAIAAGVIEYQQRPGRGGMTILAVGGAAVLSGVALVASGSRGMIMQIIPAAGRVAA